jgi:2-oxoisovalerate dehydrogenase E1 component beta subunit
VAPATARDAKGLLKCAIRDDNPVIYFENKFLYRRIKENLPDGEEVLTPIGKAAIYRNGTDTTVITYGSMVHAAQQAAEKMAAEHQVQLEIIDLRTLKPLDTETIMNSVAKTNRVVIVHEANLTGGIGGEISALIAEHGFELLDAPIKRVAALDTPTPYSPIMEEAFMPNAEKIIMAVRDVLQF